MQRFFAEALVTARLEHPNIVPIHDLMADAQGHLQLVMKLVEGRSWHQLIYPETEGAPEGNVTSTALSLDDHLGILLKVCDAVSFAHDHGILHRDLKPENVMVGDHGEVLVMDWGCAVAFGQTEQHPAVPRVEGVRLVAGTPSYLPLEMAMAKCDLMGPHSDVYLLGAILYEVLTGLRPHRGEDARAVLNDAAFGTITPPALAASTREVPDELATIAMAALAKNTAERIATVPQFARRLLDYRLHAQAVTLVANARRQMASAARDRRNADDLLRQAVSAAEQANRLWVGWPTAAAVLIDARIAWAKQHLAGDAPALAVTQAVKAQALAQEQGRSELASQARDLASDARMAQSAQEARQRQLRLAKRGLVVAGVVLVVGLAGFLMLVSSEQRRTATALEKAEQALAALTHEQAARSRDQQTSAPALVTDARRAMERREWDRALKALDTAIDFDRTLIEAHQLKTNILLAASRYDHVAAAGGAWQDAGGGDATAGRLIALAQNLRNTNDAAAALPHHLLLAEIFEQQRLFSLAESLDLPRDKREALYRKRLDATWPGVGDGVTLSRDGRRLSSNPADYAQKGFALREDVSDLKPIRGMPFIRLDLTRTKVRDLTPLTGMPLEHLTLSGTTVSVLDPLSALPLRHLMLNDTRVTRLDALTGLKLESLNVGGTTVTNLTPITGMPLKELWLYSTRITDLSPLRGMPLNRLTASSSQVQDLSPLAGLPLSELTLNDAKVQDLTPLRGMQLTTLRVGNAVSDLSALVGMPLKSLEIYGARGFDLAPLADTPLSDLWVGGTGTVDLSQAPISITRLALQGVTLKNSEDLLRLRLSRLRLSSLRGIQVPDLRHCETSQLERLEIAYCGQMDLSPVNTERLKEVVIEASGAIDLSPLAKAPLRLIAIRSGCDALTWRSLGALRDHATLTTIERNGTKHVAAEFWTTYDPERFR